MTQPINTESTPVPEPLAVWPDPGWAHCVHVSRDGVGEYTGRFGQMVTVTRELFLHPYKGQVAICSGAPVVLVQTTLVSLEHRLSIDDAHRLAGWLRVPSPILPMMLENELMSLTQEHRNRLRGELETAVGVLDSERSGFEVNAWTENERLTIENRRLRKDLEISQARLTRLSRENRIRINEERRRQQGEGASA